MSEIKEYYKKQAERIADKYEELKELKNSVGESLTKDQAILILKKAQSLFAANKTFKQVYGERKVNGETGELGVLLVMAIQRILKDDASNSFKGEIDGIYGTLTTEGVRAFQKSRNNTHQDQTIDADGRAGKDTINKILELQGTTQNQPSDPETPANNTEGGSGIDREGGKYTGPLEGGVPHGSGTLLYANGDKYEGAFINGVITGMGTYTDTAGARKLYGLWNNGKYVANANTPHIAMENIKKVNLPRLSTKIPDLSINENERKAKDDEARKERINEKLDAILKAFGIETSARMRNNRDYDYNDIKMHIYEIARAISLLSDETKSIINSKSIKLKLADQFNVIDPSSRDQEGALKDDDNMVVFDYNESAKEIAKDITDYVKEFE